MVTCTRLMRTVSPSESCNQMEASVAMSKMIWVKSMRRAMIMKMQRMMALAALMSS